MNLFRKIQHIIESTPVIGAATKWVRTNTLLIAWHTPILGKHINRFVINRLATLTDPRPRRFSLWHHDTMQPTPATNGPVSDYTSWHSLTNKKFYGRHMAPCMNTQQLPDLKAIVELFKLPLAIKPKTDRNSLLFMFFAQWLTDSVLRTDMTDRRKNTSNHEVDLCQIYGLTENITRKLRESNSGKLKARKINGEEYPDLLYTTDAQGNLIVKKEYEELIDFIAAQDNFLSKVPNGSQRKKDLYVTGLENGNSSVGYIAFTTLFLRQHNKICDELVAAYQHHPAWNASEPDYFNERVFQTARLINIAIMLKLTLEEYINHISGRANFKLDCSFSEQQHWYRPNWIAVEFNLLYRWHSMVPETIVFNSSPTWDYRFNNVLFEQQGLDSVISDLSSQPAGKIGLQNTPEFLWQAEEFSLKMARDFRLCSYNDYREQFQLKRLTSFEELTKDRNVIEKLSGIYQGDINALEFLPGLFAQDASDGKLFGDLLVHMISYDAVTQIFTNPLLSKNIFSAETLSQKGVEIINSISSFQDLAESNSTSGKVTATFFVSTPAKKSQQPLQPPPLQPDSPQNKEALTLKEINGTD
jgi:prostaglandin-endoperoxide synthase 2